MYIPEHFSEKDPAEIAAILEAAPLACVVAQTAEGLIANHLPLLSAPDGRLRGHVALGNDMHRLLAEDQEVLAIFRPHDAYISANYYPTKQDHHRVVPTWNYQAVHVTGKIHFSHDTAQKRAAVGLLTRLHERRLNGDDAWKMADAPADYLEEMLERIVAFEIVPTRVLAKSKLSQNREAVDFEGVIAGLGGPEAHPTAAAMAARRKS